MMYVLGVLLMVVGIAASIALHEIGHLVPAKAFGVKCTQYMIGFGPTLWSRRRGETEYGVKAVPLGGYVRMIGMLPPRPGDAPGTLRESGTGRWGAMIEDARNQSMAEIEPGDEDRVFYKLSTPKKVVVMLGGPLVNLLIATVLLTGVLTTYGQAAGGLGARVTGVVECVRPVTVDSGDRPDACTATDRPSPAAAAGVRPGDEFVSIAGTPVERTEDIGRLIRPHVGQAIPLVVDRGGHEVRLSVTPIANEMPRLDDRGAVVTGADGRPETVTAGYIGTSNTPVQILREPVPLGEIPGYIADGAVQTATVVVRLPEKLVGVWRAAFGGEARDETGPMSVVGVGRMAGEASSGTLGTLGPESTPTDRGVMLLMLLAGLNMALFVFNLIPLMPLDGGHVAGALWEGLKRTVARAFGRPDPGYVDVAKGLPVAYAASLVLMGMAALLIYADIVAPVRM